MTCAVVEITRGPILENRHRVAIAVADSSEVVESWGNVSRALLPRSSIKMIQALPLVESGAAEAFRLEAHHLALACASHQGAPVHVRNVAAWLRGIGLDETALRCGAQPSRDKALRRAWARAARIMNNCSGKHAGFLSFARHAGHDIGAYLDPAGGVQSAVMQAFAEMTGQDAPLPYGIDGCSAPNFASSCAGVARAMAAFARPQDTGGARGAAMERLREAMRAHPVLVAGRGRACTALIEASGGGTVVKTGADGVFAGILPERGLGFCLKVEDGDRIASEIVCAALLVRHGALAPDHPTARRFLESKITDFNGNAVGERRAILP